MVFSFRLENGSGYAAFDIQRIFYHTGIGLLFCQTGVGPDEWEIEGTGKGRRGLTFRKESVNLEIILMVWKERGK